MAEAHLDAGSVGRILGMEGSPSKLGAGRHRRDLAAIPGPGSLGGDQRVARSYHAAPRRDRNDGDVAAPGMGPRRVGRGDRLGGGRGRGAVTSDGAARSSNAPFVCAAIVLSRPPRPRYPQERKILSLMILIPSVPFWGLISALYTGNYRRVVWPAAMSRW